LALRQGLFACLIIRARPNWNQWNSFWGLNADELQCLRRAGQKQHFAASGNIFREDEVGDGVSVISHGLVEIAPRVNSDIRHVFFRLGPGAIFGEMARIEDHNPGIVPEIADKLFQTFATPGKSHGTGLGLSICKQLRKTITVASGCATSRAGAPFFSFALPLAK
jgi:signal transduction histidine kinase